MKLTQVQVCEYKCIRRTGPFNITDITCLVGKNEAGKTAILQALYRLNPIIEGNDKFDVDSEYPRIDVEDYRFAVDNKERRPAVVVKATFSISDDDLEDLNNHLGKKVLKEPILTLSKGYENELFVSLNVDEKIAIKTLVENYKLSSSLKRKVVQSSRLKELSQVLKEHPEDKSAKNLLDLVSQILDHGLITYIYTNYLKKRVPKFLYFDEYYQMEGHVNLQALKGRQQKKELRDSDRPLLGLVELSRLNLDEMINPLRTETMISKLEGASNHLTKRIIKYWSQNKHLEIRFDIRPAAPQDPPEMQQGTNLWARVANLKHKVTTPLGERSRGFVWFFSFLAWFSQQERQNESLILLLDEPGLFLHAKAQEDLLGFMEMELQPNHQVIYTTHSPFMINPQRFDRVRIVEDKSMETDGLLPPEKTGTKVLTDVLEISGDSLFPIQGALGYELYQTLFIGPNNLVVEGVSDLLYLQTMSAFLKTDGREGLDSRWTITPVGGSEKVPTFIALIGAQKKMRVATLIDVQRKDVQSIENLYKKKLLKKNHVLTFADFTGLLEADIEDMFDTDFYLKLVNTEYQSVLSKPISETDLDSKIPRITVQLGKYFQASPLQNNTEFIHYRPARYLAEHSSSLRQELSVETLARFEEAFKTLNALL